MEQNRGEVVTGRSDEPSAGLPHRVRQQEHQLVPIVAEWQWQPNARAETRGGAADQRTRATDERHRGHGPR
jgi:hypothetical protein